MIDKKIVLTEVKYYSDFEHTNPDNKFKVAQHWVKSIIARTTMPIELPIKSALAFLKEKDNFIIHQIGTIGAPAWWTNFNSTTEPNIVEMLPEKLIGRLKNKTAIVCYDQSMEGYPMLTDNYNLYENLYENLKKFDIPPSQIFLTTCNLIENELHNKWCLENNIQEKITIFACNFFAASCAERTFFVQKEKSEISFTEQIDYKKWHNGIKTFNCLNRIQRPHRICFLSMLNYYNLLDNNLISFDKLPDYIINDIKPLNYKAHPAFDKINIESVRNKLPLVLDTDEFNVNKCQHFFSELYLNSWASVITETFYDETHAIYSSEKIFKPMLAMHPFIVVGHKDYLKGLQDQGFKTFNQWWDESYDSIEDPVERLEEICRVLQHISTFTSEQWFNIYTEMRETLEHNFYNLKSVDWIESMRNYFVQYQND